jgi:hypothetical protein
MGSSSSGSDSDSEREAIYHCAHCPKAYTRRDYLQRHELNRGCPSPGPGRAADDRYETAVGVPRLREAVRAARRAPPAHGRVLQAAGGLARPRLESPEAAEVAAAARSSPLCQWRCYRGP